MTGSHIVPLTKITEVRRRFEKHAAAARACGHEAATATWTYCIDALKEIAADVRDQGLRAPDGPTPADRASCRIIAETALALETEAEKCRRAAESQIGSHRQASMGHATTADAKARHLWHALMALMEHTGLGPEDLDVVTPEPLNLGK